MKTDTMKSLGFLKKSLKMNAFAIKHNEIDVGTPIPNDLQSFIGHSVAMLAQIEAWEKADACPVPQPASSTLPDPTSVDPSTLLVSP